LDQLFTAILKYTYHEYKTVLTQLQNKQRYMQGASKKGAECLMTNTLYSPLEGRGCIVFNDKHPALSPWREGSKFF
jgi:hypothetical protein